MVSFLLFVKGVPMLHNKSAFTLVELMIACLIIGILVSIAIPNYARSVEQSRCSAELANLQSMRTAALAWYAENETFAGVTIDDLETFVGTHFDDDPTFWTHAINTGINTVTFTASRVGGHWIGSTITLDQDETWGGLYPRDAPATW
jgi:type IV pilus assembly protein PilE